MSVPSDFKPRKSQKSEGEKPRQNKSNRQSLKNFRYRSQIGLFSRTAHQKKGERKSHAGAGRQSERFPKSAVVHCVQKGNRQNNAIGGDQNDVDSEFFMQRPVYFFHDGIDHLDERSDDADKDNDLQKIKRQGAQHEPVHPPRQKPRQNADEREGDPNADG